MAAKGASPAKAPAQSQVAAAAEAAAADARRWRAVAAAAAVMALLLVALQSREMRLPLGLLERSSTALGAAAAATAATSSAGAAKPAPLPCLFNTLLAPGDVWWTAANGTADQLLVRGCPLRRYSAAEARQCLAGKRLVFVGDSITRYQYLTLVHFLELGTWPPPLGGVPGQPSVANEHEWETWNTFLRGTSALFNGREACDCFREEAPPCWGKPPCWKPPEDEKFENRHYAHAAAGLAISHFTYTTQPHKLHGHFGFPPYAQDRQPCAPATCDAPADWAYDLGPALRNTIKDMQPTHLVLNTGLWGSSNAFGNDTWAEVAAAGRAAVAEQRGRVIWRTTTASLGRKATSRDHDALALAHAAVTGWGVLDAFAITRPLLDLPRPPLWDPRHFQAGVLRELNLYLLNMICHPLA